MVTPADPPAESIEPGPTELENFSRDDTAHISATKRDRIETLEREIEALAQVIDLQSETLEQPPPAARVMFQRKPPMQGEDVTALQQALGFSPDQIDGIFGKDTDHAMRMFQRQRGMNPNGHVEPNTLNVLPAHP